MIYASETQMHTEFRLTIKIYDLPDYHETAGGYMSASLRGNQEVVGIHSMAVMTIYGVDLVTCNIQQLSSRLS